MLPQVRRTRPRPDSRKQSLSHLSCHVVSDIRDAVFKTSALRYHVEDDAVCVDQRRVSEPPTALLPVDGQHSTVGANRDPLVCHDSPE